MKNPLQKYSSLICNHTVSFSPSNHTMASSCESNQCFFFAGSSPISSAGDSSSSKPNSGTSSTHDRTTSGGGGGVVAGVGVNVSATNGGLNATRRKHKSSGGLKQTPGRPLGSANYEDEDAAYFGSQSSAGGGGLDGGETGGLSTPVLSHFRNQLSSHPQLGGSATTINPSLLLETLTWKMAAQDQIYPSPSSIVGQTKKQKQSSPFQNVRFFFTKI